MLRETMPAAAMNLEQRAKSSLFRGFQMKMEMKYVMFDVGGNKIPVLFASSLVHKIMAEAMGALVRRSANFSGDTVAAMVTPVSAGLVGLSVAPEGKIICYGRSESLNLDSKPEDSEIIMTYMSGSYN